MAFKTRQISIVGAAAAVPLLVQGTGATQFGNISGNVQDPLPVVIKNEDGSNAVYIGGSDCDATHGQTIAAGGTLPLNLYGGDIPFAFSPINTVVVSVLVGRQ